MAKWEEPDGAGGVTGRFWEDDSSRRLALGLRPFAGGRDREFAARPEQKACWVLSGDQPITGPWSALIGIMDARHPVRDFRNHVGGGVGKGTSVDVYLPLKPDDN